MSSWSVPLPLVNVPGFLYSHCDITFNSTPRRAWIGPKITSISVLLGSSRLLSPTFVKNINVPHSDSSMRSVAPNLPITKGTHSLGTASPVMSSGGSLRSTMTLPDRCCTISAM